MEAPDDKDLKIIDALKMDSRRSIRSIAKETRLRPSTVHQRIQKLLGSGIIERFTLKLDNEKTRQNFIAFILLTTKRDLEKSFLDDPHVREVFGITGEYDLLVKLKFSGVEEFNDFLISMRKNKDIVKSVSMVSTINLKEEL